MSYDFGFYVIPTDNDAHIEALRAKPSVACFVKISEDEMVVLSKHNPDNKDVSSLLVTDFQGYKANDDYIYEDMFIDPED